MLDGHRPDPESLGKETKPYVSVDKSKLGKVPSKLILKDLEFKNLEKTAAAARTDDPFTF